MNFRKAAMTLAMGGAALTLIGVGVGAQFTDTATAKENISVGKLAIEITSTAGQVVNTGTLPETTVHTVTYTAPTIQSSAAGSLPLDFQVRNIGSMDVTVSVASSDQMPSPFTDILGSPQNISIPAGTQHDFAAGLQWGELGIGNLGLSYSITYTITASA